MTETTKKRSKSPDDAATDGLEASLMTILTPTSTCTPTWSRPSHDMLDTRQSIEPPGPCRSSPRRAGTTRAWPLKPTKRPISRLSRSGPTTVEELDLAPMVDVAFQLVLFFMVTATTVLYRTLEIPKPSTEQAPTAVAQGRSLEELKDDYILVEIDPSGSMKIDREPVAADMETLIERLRSTREKTHRKAMLLSADYTTRHRNCVLAYDAAIDIGLGIVIANPQPPQGPAPTLVARVEAGTFARGRRRREPTPGHDQRPADLGEDARVGPFHRTIWRRRVPEQPGQTLEARQGDSSADRHAQANRRPGRDQARCEDAEGRHGTGDDVPDGPGGVVSSPPQAVDADQEGIDHWQQEEGENRPSLGAWAEAWIGQHVWQ